MKKGNNLIIGVILIVVGAIFMMKTMGIISFSVWEGIGTYWPVGLIMIGIALVMKRKAAALIFVGITCLVLLLFIAGKIETSSADPSEFTQSIPFEEGIESINLDLDYGAGDLSIKKGRSNYLVRNEVLTYDNNEPKVKFETSGSYAVVEIARDNDIGFFPWRYKETWDLELSPDVVIYLDLDYGAVSSDFDFTGLKVANLSIDSGASGMKIKFGDYPTKAVIKTGASNLDLEFPEEIGVSIKIDGGAISLDMDGFDEISRKKEYISKNYDEAEEKIDIMISAGVSSISAQAGG